MVSGDAVVCGRGGGGLGEVEDFQVGWLGVEGETDEGAGAVEALQAGGAGVDVEEAVFLVVHHFKDVAVAADEDVGLREAEGALEVVGVVAGVAADVGEEHALAFDFEEEALVELEVEVEAVAVAPYGACGFEQSQPVEDAGAYVAGVPELVAIAEEGEDLRRECAVGVAEYADAGHQKG